MIDIQRFINLIKYGTTNSQLNISLPIDYFPELREDQIELLTNTITPILEKFLYMPITPRILEEIKYSVTNTLFALRAENMI